MTSAKGATGPRIIAAVVHLVSTRGLDEVSVRAVAAEAGVSIGAVQHHFRTKDELLAAAMEAVDDEFVQTLRSRLEVSTEPRVALREFLYLIAAVEDTVPAAVWTAFAARACVDPSIRAIHTRAWQRTEDYLSGLLGRAHPGLVAPADTAAALLALTDGISVARAAEEGRLPADRARRLIDSVLDRI